MAPRPPLLLRLAAGLEARPVKAALSLLILVSVLPIQGLEDELRPYFLGIFGVELLLRAALLRERGRERSRLDVLLFAFDVLAWLSFLPLEQLLDAHAAHALPVLRLSRLFLLLRFTREIAVDLYAILTRRELLEQFGLVTLAVWGLAFGASVLLSHLAVAHDYDGRGPVPDTTFIDRIWWSFRQLESADNLVANLRVHPLVAVISLGLTMVGVFITSFIIGIGANVVDQVVRAARRRPVGYAGHTLVIGPVHEAEMLVQEFVRLYERHRALRSLRLSELWVWLVRRGPPPTRHAFPRMALLGTEDDPPAYLYAPRMRWVAYRKGDSAQPEALGLVGAAGVKRALILARPDAGPDADAVTAMTLSSFRMQNRRGHVFVEVQESKNRDLLQAVGGPGTYPLDMQRFLGFFLCQHLITPGVESLYTDLMTADGSEFYTHIFLGEQAARIVAALGEGPGGEISFSRMARAACQNNVVLAGVLLGEAVPVRREGELVPAEGLVQWLNPLLDPIEGSPAWALGARAGRVPARRLRGLIGVSATYAPLRRYGRELLMGRGIAPAARADGAGADGAGADGAGANGAGADGAGANGAGADGAGADGAGAGADGAGANGAGAARAWAATLSLRRSRLKRVLIVGYSPALPSLLHALAQFVPGIEVTLVLGERGDERMPLADRLASLGVTLAPEGAPPGSNGATLPLPRGGSATVYTQHGHDLASLAVRCAARGAPASAAVFLSEPEGLDRDARTAMRLIRFARALESGELAHGARLHVLAEFSSVAKGEHVRCLLDAGRCGFAGSDRLQLSLVSTERIKNYFMVHSAFVPGVTTLYDELLDEGGQDLVRVEAPPLGQAERADGAIRFEELRAALEPRGVIPVALELDDGAVLLNPEPGPALAPARIRAVYALARSQDLVAEGDRQPEERDGGEVAHGTEAPQISA
ncbi:hypothetical protein WMF28_35220 [Sorangium sp. So ce590]|uniref:hypothetical protein n=1 Tax=Sorangium sp. So ce590 TaxID=3133317 RepID=UPI003F5EFD31